MRTNPTMSHALQAHLDAGAQLVWRGRSGSHAYGLATANSDLDERGIIVWPDRAFADLETPPEQLSDAKHDHVYYSLRRLFGLLMDANPGALELIYTPADCVLEQDVRIRALFSQAALFVSQANVRALLQYGLGQIRKARGHNKWINQPQPEAAPKPTQFCYWIPQQGDGLPARPRSLDALPTPLNQCHVARVEHGGHLYRLYAIGPDAKGVFRAGKHDAGLPVCESIPHVQEHECFIGLLIFNQQAYQKAKLDHQHYWEWRRNRNESRWQAQEAGTMDFDAKNMMHCIRLLMSAEHILKHGAPLIRVDSAQREFLLAIKQGQHSYKDLVALAEQLNTDCSNAMGHSALPMRCDPARVRTLYQQLCADFR